MNSNGWLLESATKDEQSIAADWQLFRPRVIAGVAVREVRNVPRDDGCLTELYRRDWELDGAEVAHVFQVVLLPGAVSAWHAHEHALDRLFIAQGLAKIVLYDARSDSPTRGVVNVFRLGDVRPGLLVVPPRVWHGLQNVGDRPCTVVNLADRVYCYEDPDHWRVASDCAEIPYRFEQPPATLPCRA
jgi:dTDP-4-dehydrorhamnose 3,5-epimerase